jgi:hypothetical protein
MRFERVAGAGGHGRPGSAGHASGGIAPPAARGRRAAALALWPLCAVLQGCSREASPAVRGNGDEGGDLSLRCERALERADAAAVRPLSWAYAPVGVVGDETHPLGRIVGAAWHPRQQRLYVLDAVNQKVMTYGARGEYLGSFGRRGKGPGEFDELGGAHGSRAVYNQLALLGDGHLVVNDFGLLHVFDTAGRFVGRMSTGGVQAGPHAIRHLGAISDSAVLFAETGAMRLQTSDREVRTGLQLVEASLRGEAIDTAEWGRMRNTLHRFPPFERMPPRDPYGSYFRRTWDAIPSGVLAIPSQTAHGLCFFDRESRLLRAFRVRAPLKRVDQAERSRIQEDLRSKFGAAVPMVGGSWDDHFKVWPETVPTYVDVALAPDSIAWVERPLPDESRMVDLYHVERGYLGSLKPLGERLPIAFASGCAFVVDLKIPAEVRGENYFYGLRRWCRAADPAAAAAAGGGPSPQQGRSR